MTNTETLKIITILASNYKSIDEQIKDKDKLKIMADTWYSCLEDMSYELCALAVKKSIIQSKYPPTIHEVRKNAVDIVTKNEYKRNPVEAWNEAYSMISKGSYMTQDEFDTHNDDIKNFFGGLKQVKELAMTDSDIVNTVTKGQFLKQFEIIQQRQSDNRLIPDSMNNQISKLLNRIDIKQICN